MPKLPPFPAPAGLNPLAQPKAKPKGFDQGCVKGPKALKGARLTMKKTMLPGKSGQR